MHAPQKILIWEIDNHKVHEVHKVKPIPKKFVRKRGANTLDLFRSLIAAFRFFNFVYFVYFVVHYFSNILRFYLA